MLHFIPESPTADTALPGGPAVAGPYAEAVARLASIRQALACVEQVAGDEPSTRDSEARLAVMWPSASPVAKRCFEARSALVAAGAAAGLEALAVQHDAGNAANAAAVDKLSQELRRGLDGLDAIFSL